MGGRGRAAVSRARGQARVRRCPGREGWPSADAGRGPRRWPTGSQRPFPRTLDRDTDRTRPTPRGEAGSRSQRLSFRLLNSSVWKCGFSTGACALYTRVSVCAHVRYTHTEVYTHASCTHTCMECTCTVPCHVHARCTPCPCTCLLRTHGTRSRTRAHTSMRRAVCSHSHTGTEARAYSWVTRTRLVSQPLRVSVPSKTRSTVFLIIKN